MQLSSSPDIQVRANHSHLANFTDTDCSAYYGPTAGTGESPIIVCIEKAKGQILDDQPGRPGRPANQQRAADNTNHHSFNRHRHRDRHKLSRATVTQPLL